jgi:putative NIF3 family GTP cyclohydrolase 1 type 2
MYEAIAAGLDAFITGEPAEWARAIARESGIHFLAGGHHATETFGVAALGEHLATRFGVEHSDIANRQPGLTKSSENRLVSVLVTRYI